MSIGKCPACDAPIFQFREGKPGRPNGSYRSVKFKCADGSFMTMALCADCHDSWDDDQAVHFFKNGGFLKYLNSVYADYPQDEKNKFMAALLDKKVIGIKRKEGCLSAEDKKSARVRWE